MFKYFFPYFFQIAISQPLDELQVKFFSWQADVKDFHLNISETWTCHWNSSINDDKVQWEGLMMGYFLLWILSWGTYNCLTLILIVASQLINNSSYSSSSWICLQNVKISWRSSKKVGYLKTYKINKKMNLHYIQLL